MAPAIQSPLARAHLRFARAVFVVYVAAAGLTVAILLVTVATERRYDESEVQKRLLVETESRARSLAHQLALRQEELRRLARHLVEAGADPEHERRDLAHAMSASFGAGVALVSDDGRVLLAEPTSFLGTDGGHARAEWFDALRSSPAERVVAVRSEAAARSVLYLLLPRLSDGRLTGALVGAINLPQARTLDVEAGAGPAIASVVATRGGDVAYPATAPSFTHDAVWRRFLENAAEAPADASFRLSGRGTVLAGAPIAGTDLLLVAAANPEVLFASARTRMLTRLGVGLAAAALPLLLLVTLLGRSLREFRRAEEIAMREEHLRRLGEAASLIAHEIKNSLNGLQVGVDLLLRPGAGEGTPGEGAASGRPGTRPFLSPSRPERVAAEIKKQLQQMAEFTTELLTFSRGITPRPVSFELGAFVIKVAEVEKALALDRGVELEVLGSSQPIAVRADPGLLHVVLTNLVGNAIDALAVAPRTEPARVVIGVESAGKTARVRVRDNGPGVSAEIEPRLFEPFASGKPSGVGIGLALSRRIVKAHDGDLVLERARPGASFLMTLPLEAS